VQNADANNCLVGKAPQANVALYGQHVAFHSVTADNDLVDILDDDNVSIESDEHKGMSDMYNWLADSGMTSHITHRQDAFATYKMLPKLTVSGIGGVTASAVGKEMVFLHSECDGIIHMLQLQNVLHVPKNTNSLLSLGCWEQQQGCSIVIKCRKLSLLTKDDIPVTCSTWLSN